MEQAEPISRVCAYDRSGLGWSESAPEASTADSVIQDLRELLAAAGESPPYVLVGHSIGGLIAWLYADQNRNEVAGLVTVDGTPLLSLDAGEVRSGGICPALPAILLLLERLNVFTVSPSTLWGDLEAAGYPDWAVAATEDAGFLSSRALADAASCVDLMSRASQIRNLGGIPLVAITADEQVVADEFSFDRDSDEWRARQESMEMAIQASTSGRLMQVTDGIGHFIPRDAPELVVAAIRDVISEFRARQ
jgi:pimeloyl-ACP methyl ester carboxylesterase